jgi:hypothetical protein
MDIQTFFYKLFLTDSSARPTQFLGSAFPVAAGGGLLTCRHVVDVPVPTGSAISVFDPAAGSCRRISEWILPADPDVDMAFLPAALSRDKQEFFPVLTPNLLQIGESVYSFGYFAIGGRLEDVEQGYFSGKIVNFFGQDEGAGRARFMLPYPILEGMSGSPVLTYHNGPKLVGMAFANRSSRILASEIVEYSDGGAQLKETVNRIVEFGISYHPAAIVQFLNSVRAPGIVVSDARVQVPGLE